MAMERVVSTLVGYDTSDVPPTYHTVVEDVPNYSSTPAASESVLESNLPSRRNPSSRRPHRERPLEAEYVYEAGHIEVNLGPPIWGLHSPAYGLEGSIKGTLKLSEIQSNVTWVAVKLLGEFVVRSGAIREDRPDPLQFLCQEIELYSASNSTWRDDYQFSFSLPARVDINRKETPLPMSSGLHIIKGTSTFNCEILYKIQAIMRRKGLRKREVMNIPISYLPRSRPTQPPVIHLPWPSDNYAEFPRNSNFQNTAFSTFIADGKSSSAKVPVYKSVYLTMPSSTSFSSGAKLPFIITLSFGNRPTLAKLLVPTIQVQLVKEKKILRTKGLAAITRTLVISTGDIIEVREISEGVTQVRGVIQLGKLGRERSWSIEGLASVKYILQSTLAPKETFNGMLPSLRSEIRIKLTTDPWQAGNTEDVRSTPALELAKALDASRTKSSEFASDVRWML